MKIYFTFSRGYALALCLFLLVAFSFLSIASESAPKTALDNEGQRALFLEQYGLNVGDPLSIKTVTVPLEFDEEYKKFNAALISGGYDINSYKGSNLTEYTYNTGESIVVHLLLDEGILVGADCVNLESGSIHPLAGE